MLRILVVPFLCFVGLKCVRYYCKSFQIYGEEIEYAEDIFSSGESRHGGAGASSGGCVTRQSSKKGKAGTNYGDSSSTSPERNRKDDIVKMTFY